MIRVGIIGCQKFWKIGCPGIYSHVLCFEALNQRQGPLGKIPDAIIADIQPCQGCPGDHRLELARQMLISSQVHRIVFASCMFTNAPCLTAETSARQIETMLHCQVIRGSYYPLTDESRKYQPLQYLSSDLAERLTG